MASKDSKERLPTIKSTSATKFDPSKFSVSNPSGAGNTGVFDPSEAARAKTPVALGMMLEEAGLVSRDMVNDLISSGNESAQSLKKAMVQQGLVSEEDILNALAEDLQMERIHLKDVEITPELLELVDGKFAKKNKVFPVSFNDHECTIALSDPTNVSICDDLQMLLGKTVHGVIASEDDIIRYVQKYYEGDEIGRIYEEFTRDSDDPYMKSLADYETLELSEGDHTVRPEVRYVDLIFKQAVHEGASDIHIEPGRLGVMLRFRIDGVLQELPMPPKKWKNAILSRLKVLSGMDLAEKRIPQDGRIKLTLPDKKFDLRVSCLPSIFGESIVMRILDQEDILMGLEDVGFLPSNIKKFSKLIKSPNGIILMTGPTGSGKTTTLNSALSTLNTPEEKIITVEDPVEYMIQGINQMQVNKDAEVDFGVALRSMLRMSPDVIMVGEIRDLETAEIAIRAALTGHLVFSTLHTNDAPSATIRLIDMGVKPFLVASSIQAVVAQRLIRRLCTGCKIEKSYQDETFRELGYDPAEVKDVQFMYGAGCDRCSGTGYRGRTAIHEIFTMDAELRKMVIRAESNIRIKKYAMQHGMSSLRMDGFEKAKLGQTTIEEVMRITQEDAS